MEKGRIKANWTIMLFWSVCSLPLLFYPWLTATKRKHAPFCCRDISNGCKLDGCLLQTGRSNIRREPCGIRQACHSTTFRENHRMCDKKNSFTKVSLSIRIISRELSAYWRLLLLAKSQITTSITSQPLGRPWKNMGRRIYANMSMPCLCVSQSISQKLPRRRRQKTVVVFLPAQSWLESGSHAKRSCWELRNSFRNEYCNVTRIVGYPWSTR